MSTPSSPYNIVPQNAGTPAGGPNLPIPPHYIRQSITYSGTPGATPLGQTLAPDPNNPPTTAPNDPLLPPSQQQNASTAGAKSAIAQSYTGAPGSIAPNQIGGTSSTVSGSGGTSGNNNQNGTTPNGLTPGQSASVAQGGNAALEDLATGGSGEEEALFGQYMAQDNGVLSSIDQEYDDEYAAQQEANTQGNEAEVASLVSSGLQGSTSAAAAMQAAGNVNAKNLAVISTQRQAAVASEIQGIQERAQTNAVTADQNAVTAQATMVANATASIKNMAAAEMNWTAFKQSFPAEYQTLVNELGGDPNQADAIFAMNKPQASVLSTQVNGSTVLQITKDPVTGAVSGQSYTLPFTPPTAWTATKGTNYMSYVDPNNPGNSITEYIDALGNITYSGIGTGATLLDQEGVPNAALNNTSTAGIGSSATNANGGNGASPANNIANSLGVPATTPLASIITGVASTTGNTVGVNDVLAALAQNEGGEVPGTQNNPYNAIFAGQPGAYSSGIKMPGTNSYYASFNTSAAAQAWAASQVQSAASGNNKLYGSNPTLQSFIDAWTGTSSNQSGNAGAGANQGNSGYNNGLDAGEYGKLAGVNWSQSGVNAFNPNSTVDQAAWNYITNYLSTGSVPSSTSGRSGQTIAITSQIASRAKQLYFAATGQNMPNATTLSNNLGLINSNNTLLNTLNVQEGTIAKNFGLNLDNINENSINQTAPAINKIVDWLSQQSGSPSVAQYLAQNATLTKELATLLSVKNASGTTVADSLNASSLLSANLSADQQKSILKILLQEADNQKQTILSTNSGLYGQTDPLGVDPSNPQNMPGYTQATALGFTPNGDGTYTDPATGDRYDGNGNLVTQ